jgi:hypothetical protein
LQANGHNAIDWWENRIVLKPATDYALTSADVARFSLGVFIPENTSISDTHKIVNSGVDIGKLVLK